MPSSIIPFFIIYGLFIFKDSYKHFREDKDLASKIAFGYVCVLGLVILYQAIDFTLLS